MRSVDLDPSAARREMAVIAYHFHWGRGECLALSRPERRSWLDEIERINRDIARAMKAGSRRKR